MQTLTYINNRPVLTEVNMKTLEDCYDELTDNDDVYIQTFINFVDEDLAERLIKGICTAKTERDMVMWAKDIQQAVADKLDERALELQKKSINPLED